MYKYDVFLSYSRVPEYATWVNESFLPFFKTYLGSAIPKKNVEIFLDTTAINSGAAWKFKIREALVYSKVIVPIFCPDYFMSEWCMREFCAMESVAMT